MQSHEWFSGAERGAIAERGDDESNHGRGAGEDGAAGDLKQGPAAAK